MAQVPVIVHGVPKNAPKEALAKFVAEVEKTLASVMQVSNTVVTCMISSTASGKGRSRHPMFIEAWDTWDKGQTARTEIASKLKDVTVKHFERAEPVTCIVRKISPEDGLACYMDVD